MSFEGLADQAASAAEAPSTEQSLQQPSSEQHSDPKTTELPDLEKVGKFTYKGEQWDTARFEKERMMERDYRQKTMQLAEDRKKEDSFKSALAYDLRQVKSNPNLAQEFKKVYPQAYHALLEDYLPKDSQAQTMQLPAELRQEIDMLKNGVQSFQEERYQAKAEANLNTLNQIESNMMKKYPHAQIESILTSIDQYVTQNKIQDIKDIPEKSIETLFKSSHEKIMKLSESIYSEKLKAQKDANRRGQDIGKGGGIPGEAPKKLRLKDVQDEILAQLKNQ